MNDRGVREGLIARREDIVRETKNRMKVGEVGGKVFGQVEE